MTDESKPEVTYTVQMLRSFTVAKETGEGTETYGAWQDVATVKVKAGTKRRTVLKQALASMEVGDQAPRLRALDMESAEVHEPTAKQTTEWVL
jgi:hypothetical protein